ncbi:MarR family winged helix-turn-helix transcriptional regulator [Streptacidiphilus sp. ASG 303]|uniref:MarR family winged helix-turn-helix transcriptional regulator n=1 Tax=Streptomycetaceae TaxID=2062 RepID=UPI001E28D8E8|nr:MarR family transcriptional regulator [Streptacidiphilus sp. ASG 303]MCD0481426.1 MarR family transcriptional regulator [Streptacidiphilus sp. ASG 303]
MVSQESCGELLLQLSSTDALIRTFKRELRPGGPRGGFALLAALHRCGGLRVGDLAELFEIDVSAASRQLADLEERGWAERVPNPQDRRSWHARLTPEGERVARERTARARDLLAEAIADWPEEDAAALADLLGRLRTSFDARRVRVPDHPSRTASGAKGL